MWLSKQIMKFSGREKNTVTADITQTSGAKISAQGAIEHREVPVIAPFGIAYMPTAEQTAVITSSDGNNFCIGVKMPDKSLSPGDLLLYSGTSASILIKSNGSIAINGSVKINGVSV